MLAFFANVSPHGKGGTNLRTVESYQGNTAYDKQIADWKKWEDDIRRQLEAIEKDFLEELALRRPNQSSEADRR